MKFKQSVANGTIKAPPSKSMAHRYLICAALSDGKSIIKNIDFSEDIKATFGCLEQLGVKTEIIGTENEECKTVVVYGAKKLSKLKECKLNCNESGSTLRFFIPVSMLFAEKSFFSGSEVLMTRPMSVYETICKAQNICFERKNGGIEIQGNLFPDTFEIPGNISSQFITGLLFVLPVLNGDSKIILIQEVESKPYIDMTIQVQNAFGVKIEWLDERTLFIKGNQKYKPVGAEGGVEVEGDYSNAAFFEALNTAGSSVDVEGLNPKSLQGDKIYKSYFESLKKGFATIDISDCPDLGPVLFVVAALNHGGEFTGTKRLKIKESNRGQVMCQELAKFGVKTLFEENRIVIYEGKVHTPQEEVLGHNDHRIVMSLSVLMTVTGGTLKGHEAVKKSFPSFFECLEKLGIEMEDLGE